MAAEAQLPPLPPPTPEELDALLAPLSAADRAIALAEFDRVLAARPAETDLASYGCVGSFFGLMLLVALPNVARFLPVSVPLRMILMWIGIALIVGGLVMRMLVPTKRLRDAGQRAKYAIDALATLDYSANPAAWFRQASIAMIDAFYSGGPWTAGTFDFAWARNRIGPALPRLIAVETLFRLERAIYPVFTEFVSPQRAPDRTEGS